MSFDKPTRNLLAKTVAACRERLAVDIADQLQSAYGLYPDGTKLDVAHTEADRRAAQDLRALLTHYESNLPQSKNRSQTAHQRLVREAGFTLLNRLAALRLCEERGLVIECVRQGMESDGFRLYDMLAGGALGNRHQTYRAFLERLFDELAHDLGELFDRINPLSHLFPSEAALNGVLDLLNNAELTRRGLWAQDETIGWIYQYYNDPAERKKMRDESQAPRNSRELAVRNQFFTPRYVVEFLTDNTLGRLWVEMRGGQSLLNGTCRYLVVSDQLSGNSEQDTGSPLPLSGLPSPNPKSKIANRKLKDPRDLKILDPACGSGHFLLYTFDLLLQIYEEAWAEPNLPPFDESGTWLARDYPSLDDLRRAAPELILRHNLHGVDIDPRAAQIAALALWLRAQRAWQELGVPAAERPQVTRTNMVVAEPMPGDARLLEEFIAGLADVPFIGQLVRVVFEKMKLAGEAGSLLKVEVDLREAVAAAKKQWLTQPAPKQMGLWAETVRPHQEQLHFDLSGITDEQFWLEAEGRALAALSEYTRQVDDGQGARRRLFADEAGMGFAFVDLCRKKYDVILMNPPFGEIAQGALTYLRTNYPISADNLLCAFVTRAQMLSKGGFVGAILDRSFVVKESYKEFREQLINSDAHPTFLFDLGWNVLDANVEVCAMVLSSRNSVCSFADLRQIEEKSSYLLDICHSPNLLNTESLKIFLNMPNSVFVYDMPKVLRVAFANSKKKLAENAFFASRGMAGSNADHLYRLVWEVTPNLIGLDKKWVIVQKGSPYSPHYYGIDHIVYCDSGNFAKVLSYDSGRVTGIENYGKFGLSFGKRTEFMYAFPMNTDQVFSIEGQAIFFIDHFDLWQSLAIVNSSPYQELINHLCGQHKYHGYLNTAYFDFEKLSDVGIIAKEIWSMILEIDATNETSLAFEKLNTIVLENHSFNLRLDEVVEQKTNILEDAARLRNEINQKIQYSLGDIQHEFRGADTFVDHIKVLFGFEESIYLETLSFVSFFLGISFGRWDVRLVLDDRLLPKPMKTPQHKLPVCPSAALVNEDGYPATPNNIASEVWLKARPNVITLPEMRERGSEKVVLLDGKEYPASIPDSEYPLPIPWDGILVDDPGLDGKSPHPEDLVERVRLVLRLLWPENHAAIEAEACKILGVNDLRDYFRKPGGFFADHLKRYSKSRRQAPIYWPLSTASGGYTLWLYYPRLSAETLPTALNRFVDPKIAAVSEYASALEVRLNQISGRAATDLRDEFDRQKAFLAELRDFRAELLHISALPYQPDLNDGVIINAAPFHRLFRLSKWSKDTESAWKKLQAGEYDWSHIAFVLWPERVREICKTDKSIAIAHGLESVYVEVVEKKVKGKKKQAAEANEMNL